jgi:arylsulfatase A-like enzyme
MSSEANWIEAEPLWIAAERQGVATATYFWVGSETDWHEHGTRYRIAPFDNARSTAAKVDQLLAWLDEPDPPRLMMSYWAGVDSVAHDSGPDHEEVQDRLADEDRELQRLMQGFDERDLWQGLTLLVVSDHGMAETGEIINAQAALEAAGIPAVIHGYASAQVYLENPEHLEDAIAALTALPHTTVRKTNALPGEWRMSYPGRLGDLMITTEPPYLFASVNTIEHWLWRLAYQFGWRRGGHGYDSELDEMGGIFYAMGREVPGGRRLGEVHQIDVAPTVSRLLGIDPPAQAEGRSVFNR